MSADCACRSPYAKDCLALRYGYAIPFGQHSDAEECQCPCHDEHEDDWQDEQRAPDAGETP